MLTAAKLMSLNLRKAFLEFMSACETAKSDKVQPDQAIHLACAMFFAGFKCRRDDVARRCVVNADQPLTALRVDG